MKYKTLFLLVEGNDDAHFIKRIIKPYFDNKFKIVKVIKYAELKKNNINKYLRSININEDVYIYFRDINSAKCVTKKKNEICESVSEIEPQHLIVVIKEIESWYLAGLDRESSQILNLQYLENTDDITKGKFKKLIPQNYSSRRIFMAEILYNYSIDAAEKKNKSFAYFWNKYFQQHINFT